MSDANTDRRKPGSKPIYVNHTVMTKKTLKEVLKLNWRAGAGWMRIVLLVVAGAAFVFAVVQFIQFGLLMVGQLLSMLLLAGMSLYLAERGYTLRQSAYIKGQMHRWGDDTLEKTVRFYPEEIMQESRLGALHFPYDQLRRVLIGKSIMIIKLEDGGLIMDRFGFEGDVDDSEVVAFLDELTPPPPPKKKLRERLADARAASAEAVAAKTKANAAPPHPAITALMDDDEDEDGGDRFDIGDDSWVDEMDAEEEAGKAGADDKKA